MAVSRESTLWHLTPAGWVAGSASLDSGRRERPTPADRVLTCRYHEIMKSPFKAPEESVEVEWEGQDHDAIAKLKAKYGECPHAIRA